MRFMKHMGKGGLAMILALLLSLSPMGQVMSDSGRASAALIGGSYDGFVYSPRGPYTATDNTNICVQKWDFNNPKHPYEYYKYLAYWYNRDPSAFAKYADYAKYVNYEADASCSERCQNFSDRGYYEPRVLGLRIVSAGETAVFGYYAAAMDYTASLGYGLQVPSVYLYDVVDVTEGEEYIEGGREGLRFYAGEADGLSGLWPYPIPKLPHIRMNAPIKADAPVGAAIQIRFRLAYGFEDAWYGNWDGYKGTDDGHREDNYYWYVEDFIYTLSVGEPGSDPPGGNVDATHHVYMPADTSTTIQLYKPFYSYQSWWGYYEDGCYNIKDKEILENGAENVAVADSPIMGNAAGGGNNLTVPISSHKDAEAGATTAIYVKYIYGSDWNERTEKIVVHIIEPRRTMLEDAGSSINVLLCESAAGKTGAFTVLQEPQSSDNAIVQLGSGGQSGYKAVRKKLGTATANFQYEYCEMTETGIVGIEYVAYVEKTVIVDVVEFVDDSDPGGSSDPVPVDKLKLEKIVKELVKTRAEAESVLTADQLNAIDFSRIVLKGDGGLEKVRIPDRDGGEVTLLYKITVTGETGAAYAVADPDSAYAGGDAWTGRLGSGTKTDTAAELYVSKTFTAREIQDGKVSNTASLNNNGERDTDNPTGGNGISSSDSPAIKTYMVTVNYVLSDGTVYTYTYEADDQSGYDHSKGDGTLLPEDRKEPEECLPVSGTAVEGGAGTKAPAKIVANGITYVFDEPENERQNSLQGTVNGADVTLNVYYAEDMTGNGKDSGGNPTDTSDGIPDKYQAKVVYAASEGGSQDGTTKYVTVMKDGRMAVDGFMSIEGAEAAANTGYDFVDWTAAAAGHENWSYGPKTDRRLAADAGIPAKGKAVYTFKANFSEKAAQYVTVTFDANGGMLKGGEKVTIRAGAAVGGRMPMNPERKGYLFESWNTEAGGGGTQFDAAVQVNADMTVYAQWRQIAVTVSDTDGGPDGKGQWTDGGEGSKTFHPDGDGKVTLPGREDIAPPDGKELDKWKDEEGSMYVPGAVIEPEKDMAFTPVWKDREEDPEPDKYTVNWVDPEAPEGGQIVETRTDVELDENGKVPGSLYPKAPSHDGKEFTGWTEGGPVEGVITITAAYREKESGNPMPAIEDIRGLIQVMIIDAGAADHGTAMYRGAQIAPESVTIGKVRDNGDGTFGCDVTISPAWYVSSYNAGYGQHSLAADQQPKTVTLSYKALESAAEEVQDTDAEEASKAEAEEMEGEVQEAETGEDNAGDDVEAADSAEGDAEATDSAEGDAEAAAPAEDDVEAADPAEDNTEAADPAEGDAEAAVPAKDNTETAVPAEDDVEAVDSAKGDAEAAAPAEDNTEAADPAEGDTEAAVPAEGDVEAADSAEDNTEAAAPAKGDAKAAISVKDNTKMTDPAEAGNAEAAAPAEDAVEAAASAEDNTEAAAPAKGDAKAAVSVKDNTKMTDPAEAGNAEAAAPAEDNTKAGNAEAAGFTEEAADSTDPAEDNAKAAAPAEAGSHASGHTEDSTKASNPAEGDTETIDPAGESAKTADPAGKYAKEAEGIAQLAEESAAAGKWTLADPEDGTIVFIVSCASGAQTPDPEDPADPVHPTDPADPSTPEQPEAPADSADPANPEQPEAPADPVPPADPEQPANPAEPVPPAAPTPAAVVAVPAAAAPAAPVTPTVPAAEEEEPEDMTIPEEETPQAEPETEPEPEADLAEGGLEDLAEKTPLAPGEGSGRSWALLNLLLAIFTALVSLLLLTFYFVGRRREDEDEDGMMNEEGEGEELRRKGLVRLLSILPAAFAIVTFILTEDMRSPMAFVDRWTLLMVLYAAANAVLAVLAVKEREEDGQRVTEY